VPTRGAVRIKAALRETTRQMSHGGSSSPMSSGLGVVATPARQFSEKSTKPATPGIRSSRSSGTTR
jgi:hypothetical protein